MLELLNQKFAIGQSVRFIQGRGGIPCISVRSAHSTSLISLLGGQVLSFTPAGQVNDLFFVSDNAYFKIGKAIKGGTPVCWPWFATHPEDSRLPFHGLVRNRLWSVESVTVDEQDLICIDLFIDDSAETWAIWPFRFKLRQRISISSNLCIELQSQNTSDEQEFRITQAIHTYFRVGDIHQTWISGLDGKSYLDKVEDFKTRQQQGLLVFASEVDRIYQQVSYPLEIHDSSYKRQITIDSEGSSTAVVWNPWQEIARSSADLCEKDYQSFVCVESANAADEVITLNPGESYSLKACYRIQLL